MEDTSGFYKQVDGEWHYAPNFVISKDYELHRNGNRVGIDGWAWYSKQPY